MVRGKFLLKEVRSYSNGDAPMLVFIPVPDYSIPTESAFARENPQGRLELVVSNQFAIDQMKKGELYYLDLTKVERESL